MAIEPSALHSTSRIAGASRAPSRPSYVTEQRATSNRMVGVCHARSERLDGVPVASPTMVVILGAAGSFYDEVLRELVFALGAALFVANAFALFRRRSDARSAQRSAAHTRPGSPVRGNRRAATTDLKQAPLARTVTYLVIGFVVMVAGLGALINK